MRNPLQDDIGGESTSDNTADTICGSNRQSLFSEGNLQRRELTSIQDKLPKFTIPAMVLSFVGAIIMLMGDTMTEGTTTE